MSTKFKGIGDVLKYLKEYKNSLLNFQEYFLFKPNQYQGKLQNIADFSYSEYYFSVEDTVKLRGILFKSQQPDCKGLIFYLHGNKAVIDHLDINVSFYVDQGYDLFTWDYRGYGRSDSVIQNEDQFYADAEKVFSELMRQLSYQKVILLGYSLGTGLAIKLAADHSALISLLILQAPYYSIVDVVRQRFFRFIPKKWLKYPLESYRYIDKIKIPVVIFHGKKDTVISYQSSIKLKQLLKEEDQLYLIDNLDHGPFDEDQYFCHKLVAILHEN